LQAVAGPSYNVTSPVPLNCIVVSQKPHLKP
jgi:hypothetical protein